MIIEFRKVVLVSGVIAMVSFPLFVDRKEDAEQPHTHQEYDHQNWAARTNMAEAQSTATIATTYAGPVTGISGPAVFYLQ